MPPRGRVLVIEDDETLRETLAEVMEDEGHEVRAAANGHEALERLAEWEAEVIILDLMMPLMDAYEFRAHQRRSGTAPAARVLILSAARDLDTAADRLEASALLTKPFSLDEVVDTVGRLLAEPADRDRAGPSPVSDA